MAHPRPCTIQLPATPLKTHTLHACLSFVLNNKHDDSQSIRVIISTPRIIDRHVPRLPIASRDTELYLAPSCSLPRWVMVKSRNRCNACHGYVGTVTQVHPQGYHRTCFDSMFVLNTNMPCARHVHNTRIVTRAPTDYYSFLKIPIEGSRL